MRLDVIPFRYPKDPFWRNVKGLQINGCLPASCGKHAVDEYSRKYIRSQFDGLEERLRGYLGVVEDKVAQGRGQSSILA
jgi:hypothetical protein